MTRARLAALLVALLAIVGCVAVGSSSAAATPENLFGATVPAVKADSDTSAVELGVQFRPAVDGTVSGVRFYKGTGNTGTHSGSVWSAAGARLVTKTFTGETSTGWQTVTFATPLAVTAGATYTASYFAPKGHYAANNPYTWPKVSGNLTGVKGVYRYGSTSGFPTSVYQTSNYWVDVTFAAGTVAPPTTTPTVTPVTTPTTATAPVTTTAPTTTTTPLTTTTTASTTTTPPPSAFIVAAGTPSAMVFPEKPGLRTPISDLTPYTGPTNVTGTTTASNCVITQQIQVAASGDLTLDNCWIKVNVADAGYGMIGKAGRITITHSLIDGTGFQGYTFPLILEGGGRVAFSEFIGNTDNMRMSSSDTFEWNWIHQPKTLAQCGTNTDCKAAHSDGVEVYYGARPAGVTDPHIFVENNYINISGAAGENSSVNVTNDFGPIDGVRVKGNTFMPAGGYALYLRGDGYCGCGGNLANIEVQNNRWFSSTDHLYGGFYGTRSYTPAVGVTDWSGNTFTYPNGTTTIPLTLDNYQPS